MAPDVVRRTMQDATLRKEALRELRSSLGKTTPGLREGADRATGATPSAVSVPPLRKADGSTAEETAKDAAKQDEAKAAEAKKKVEEARAAEAKRKEDETKAAEDRKKEEEARAAEVKRKEEEAKAAEAKRTEEEARAAEAKRKEEEARATEVKRKEEGARAAEAKRQEEDARLAEAKKEEEAKAAEAKKKEEAKGAEANSKSGDSPGKAVASPAPSARSFFPSLDFTASFRSFNLNLNGIIQEVNTASEQLNKVAGLEEIAASAPQVRPESTPALRGSESSEPSSVSSTQEPPAAAQAPSPESVGEWRAETDAATGNTYYWNTVTREVTWEKPKSD